MWILGKHKYLIHSTDAGNWCCGHNSCSSIQFMTHSVNPNPQLASSVMVIQIFTIPLGLWDPDYCTLLCNGFYNCPKNVISTRKYLQGSQRNTSPTHSSPKVVAILFSQDNQVKILIIVYYTKKLFYFIYLFTFAFWTSGMKSSTIARYMTKV
jgi:hypothetical protein